MNHIHQRLSKTINQGVQKLCRRLTNKLNDLSLRIQMRAFPLCSYFSQSSRTIAARILGDLACLISDLPKKNIWLMTGSGSRIVFIGSRVNSLELLPLLVNENATPTHIGQVWAFGLSKRTKKQLKEVCDLVICELSRYHWFRSPAPIAFTVTQFVSHLFTYPEKKSDLLSGKRFHAVRRRVNRIQKAGCDWRFSRSRADFDLFYERMYLPFVRMRHDDLALITPYPFHWNFYIQKAGGGLVIATMEGNPVAGALCLVVDQTCYSIEMGIIDGDTHLYQEGMNAYLFWAVAVWGQQQGAKYYNLGGSLAWRSNTVFQWKAGLGAMVTRNWFPNPIFAFSADQISSHLKDRINDIGFVNEVDDRLYGLMIGAADKSAAKSELQEALGRSKKDGLSGICVTGPGHRRKYYDTRFAK